MARLWLTQNKESGARGKKGTKKKKWEMAHNFSIANEEHAKMVSQI